MKIRKVLFIAISLLVFNSGYGQLKGLNFKSAIEVKKDDDLGAYKNKLVRIGGGYCIFFGKPTPIAVRRAIKKIKELCLENDFDFNSPTEDESHLGSTVDNIYDYESLSTSLIIEYSEVEKVYRNEEGSIMLKMGRNTIFIAIVNTKK